MTAAATQRTDGELEAEVAALHEELAAPADDRMRAVNEKHGDDHAVNLTKLRAVAKRLRARPDLARALWETPAEDSTPKLLALLISRPKQYGEEELDAMLREAPTPTPSSRAPDGRSPATGSRRPRRVRRPRGSISMRSSTRSRRR